MSEIIMLTSVASHIALLLMIVAVIAMLVAWYRSLPIDNTPKEGVAFATYEEVSQAYEEAERKEIEDMNRAFEEAQPYIDRFLEEGAKERGITVEEYSEQIVNEEIEEERKRKERWSA